jgi:hypothetical protein
MSNLIVSEFSVNDLNEYLDMLNTFHKNSTIKQQAKFDRQSCSDFLISCSANKDIVILSCKDNDKLIGITGGLLFPLYFNINYKVVQELWWWVEEDKRGSDCGKLLYNALESWAKHKQADAFFMIALEDSKVETMAKVYKRKGFKGMERTFIKELKNGN